ncbi:hypothetical protein AB0M68_08450 [Streptomyces sp. NPDC051453]|uniref:GtrA family protein n=1 Tax=Streptomyces sp. NPDC051453 TaxID=3154941 RepID=UPI0034437316
MRLGSDSDATQARKTVAASRAADTAAEILPADHMGAHTAAPADPKENRRGPLTPPRGPLDGPRPVCTRSDARARHQLQGLVAFFAGLALSSGALAVAHRTLPEAPHVELGALIVANAAATALRFALLRLWVFRGP